MHSIGRLRGYAEIVRASRRLKVKTIVDIAFDDDGRIIPTFKII